MKRYATKIENGTVYVETDDDWLTIGSTDALLDLVGGETYEIEYDPYVGKAFDWLDTDDEGLMTFDVLEVVESMSHRERFVQHLEDTPTDRGDEYPQRMEFFAEMLTTIWDKKGVLDEGGEGDESDEGE